ncbi:hypothetical protein [Flavobacterium psychrophilum]|uniref:hypothetical protein n=1 Tax=Flavobacterium psychrophilum TaxID=96345 RepID=UPI000903FA80|nr:hypothetical protein [Flavobacterium psychrophilum]MBF2024351.1 hypothetical protein [Flavobacterium psychrophilum]MCB5983197.1 hypothetical protein [Flavobacterium psychrophilum]MCB5995443.1 hypothetical protein [Flavobacterium psychrophilum]MCB5997781.1 hypothetical protein [Flavobacterium psychrophilum]MCB6005340.1 hypothetical protein [Flavobacterium psychrophilum]
MTKPILEQSELEDLGFNFKGRLPLDNGDFFRWWSFRKNDSEIHITYEFNKKDEFISGYVDFNCEKLKGRLLTKKDIQLLIEIM